MSLNPGAKIGPYEILGAIGAGGMGEVCRARDTKLDREVAIKILPAAFAKDPGRLARFHREAKVLAALNHPNIAQIYGVEESSEGPALVMELIEGETIKGPVNEETALNYAKQIAAALEAAHEKGIVHRDLKPANIMLTPDGVIKVLDFGLAAIHPPANHDPANSPTLTMAATSAGVIMGTAGYMSPEQAAGKPVDKRADIFSFGVVLYELITGKRLFDGETISHILAAVLTQNPNLENIPPKARQLVKRCLEKDPKKRLRDIGDAFLNEEPAAQPTPQRSGHPYWATAVGMIATAVAVWLLRPIPTPNELPHRTFSFTPEALDQRTYLNRAVISPNGKHIAYVAANKLWIRDLATEQSRTLEGAGNAESPFWSPDSTQIAFATGLELRKVRVDGGAPSTLAKLPAPFSGGAWSADGRTILVSVLRNGLYTVPAEGGSLKQIIATAGVTTFYSPHFLPSSSGELLAVAGKGIPSAQTIEWVDLKAGTSKTLRPGAYPSYSSSGHILFQSEPRKGDIWALKLPPGKQQPEGEPVPVPNLGASASVSSDGTLVWADFTGGLRRRLVWRDRRGTGTPVAGEAAKADFGVFLSPDGTRTANIATELGNQDIWISDLVRSSRTRFTFTPGPDSNPRWAPSGKEIAYYSSNGGKTQVFIQAADGSGEPRPVETGPFDDRPSAWSPDGQTLVIERRTKTDSDLWFTKRKPDGSFEPARPFLQSPFEEGYAVFSPDGRLVAYVSDEAGRDEIYVRSFPDGGSKRLISVNGGKNPRWSRDGKEIFYLNGGRLFAVPVVMQGAFAAGSPVELFKTLAATSVGNPYDVSPDGKRFLVIEPADDPNAKPPSIHIVQNWTALLK